MIIDILIFFAKNEIVLGVVSLTALIGFVLTIIVTIRTQKIGRILKYNQTTVQYNKERISFQRTFEGHRKSIIEDNIKSDKLLKDILQNVEEYKSKFGDLLTILEKIKLKYFIRILKKESNKVDYNKVCNHLATLSGRLSKKGMIKNV